jgi:hypothetical protein
MRSDNTFPTLENLAEELARAKLMEKLLEDIWTWEVDLRGERGALPGSDAFKSKPETRKLVEYCAMPRTLKFRLDELFGSESNDE